MKISYVVLISNVGFILGFKLEKLENDILRHVDVQALQDVFKVHLFRNPHPKCALYGEKCDFDHNCCQTLECKMNVDRAGLKSVCLSKIFDDKELPSDYSGPDDDVGWSFTKHDRDVEDVIKDVEKESIQRMLSGAKEKDQAILNDNLNLIQELRKPLTFEDLRELAQLKEIEDLKRNRQLKELQEWKKNEEANELIKNQRQRMLEKIAKERVEQVLQEEEKQKMEIFKEMMQNQKGNAI